MKTTIKILGQTVTVGTKLYYKLVQQKKQFDDLNNSEINNQKQTTMKNLNITKGEWKVGDIDILSDKNCTICQVYDGQNSYIMNMDMDIVNSNAQLIADAGTTANKCGLLPSELLEQRNELLEACKNAMIIFNSESIYGSTRLELNEAIKKATE